MSGLESAAAAKAQDMLAIIIKEGKRQSASVYLALGLVCFHFLQILNFCI